MLDIWRPEPNLSEHGTEVCKIHKTGTAPGELGEVGFL
jgi:hypothetical protein